ncbi:hypothetical protein WJX73_006624 [Symbiochloris irregularis]|uniref:Septin-type G domain-containing protein n=1 Tax=Symbiochloris irregularis TaxID=706552 RepID=A0AAW1P1V2_9CHLO
MSEDDANVDLPNIMSVPPEELQQHVNILLVGESGLGKTTFTNQLFANCCPSKHSDQQHSSPDISIQEFETDPELLCKHLPAIRISTGDWVEHHVQDTPGREGVDNKQHMDAVIRHIQSKQALQYHRDMSLLTGMQLDSEAQRQARSDNMYDVAFFFIAPHRFKQVDLQLEYIQRLSHEVTVVLICAKADAMTPSERDAFQLHIREMINGCGEEISRRLFCLSNEIEQGVSMLGCQERSQYVPPFAVACGAKPSSSTGCDSEALEPVRKYPWGTCRTNNPLHSDFRLARQVVLSNGIHTLPRRKLEHFYAFCRTKHAHTPVTAPASELKRHAPPQSTIEVLKLCYKAMGLEHRSVQIGFIIGLGIFILCTWLLASKFVAYGCHLHLRCHGVRPWV